MNPGVFMPFTANPLAVLGVFLISLLAFDLVLVRWVRIGKVAWKRSDYFWLGIAVLGLLGSVADVRMASAERQLKNVEQGAEGSFRVLKLNLTNFADRPGHLCRTFVRNEYSPPPEEFERTQNEYNLACKWIKGVNDNLGKRTTSPPVPIEPTSLPDRPKLTDSAINELFGEVDQQFAFYAADVAALVELQQSSHRSDAELVLVFYSPFLLAVALALRITKVTGEIKLEAG